MKSVIPPKYLHVSKRFMRTEEGIAWYGGNTYVRPEPKNVKGRGKRRREARVAI